jgi:hypothetical protein
MMSEFAVEVPPVSDTVPQRNGVPVDEVNDTVPLGVAPEGTPESDAETVSVAG